MATRQLNSSEIAAVKDTADRLGVSAADLATLIAYETIGTFDPGIVGGKGNNYVGLIQFGKNERKDPAIGYKPGMTFEEQVKGPVYNFFNQRGVTPGMGLLDLYSTVNAGSPGLYGASDRKGSTVRTHVAEMQRTYGPAVQAAFSAPPEPWVAGQQQVAASTAPRTFSDLQQLAASLQTQQSAMPSSAMAFAPIPTLAPRPTQAAYSPPPTSTGNAPYANADTRQVEFYNATVPEGASPYDVNALLQAINDQDMVALDAALNHSVDLIGNGYFKATIDLNKYFSEVKNNYPDLIRVAQTTLANNQDMASKFAAIQPLIDNAAKNLPPPKLTSMPMPVFRPQMQTGGLGFQTGEPSKISLSDVQKAFGVSGSESQDEPTYAHVNTPTQETISRLMAYPDTSKAQFSDTNRAVYVPPAPAPQPAPIKMPVGFGKPYDMAEQLGLQGFKTPTFGEYNSLLTGGIPTGSFPTLTPPVVAPKPVTPLPPPITVPKRVVAQPPPQPVQISPASVMGITRSSPSPERGIVAETGTDPYGQEIRTATVNGNTYSVVVNDDGSSTPYEEGTVLCTHFMRRRWLSAVVWAADVRYSMTVDPDMQRGYHLWAKPLVAYLERGTLIGRAVEYALWPVVKAWSYEMASRSDARFSGSWAGKIVMKTFGAVCMIIGRARREYGWL